MGRNLHCDHLDVLEPGGPLVGGGNASVRGEFFSETGSSANIETVSSVALILNCFHMGIGTDQVIGSENSQVVMTGGGNNNLICGIFVESAGQDG